MPVSPGASPSWWLAQGYAQSTLTQYLIQIRKLERSVAQSFVELDVTDLRRFVLDDMSRNSPASAACAAPAVRAFYHYLVEEGELHVNPAARVQIPKVDVPPTKAASTEAIKAMIATTRHSKLRPTFLNVRDRALLQL